MRHRLWTRSMTTLACLGCLLTTSAIYGQNAKKSGSQQKKTSKQADNDKNFNAIPKGLRGLDLTSEQKTNIKKATLKYRKEYRDTWKKFHQAHAQAIELEAAWQAAVRDTLSEEAKESFDHNRMNDQKAANKKHSHASADRTSDPKRNQSKDSDRARKTAATKQTNANQKPQKVTARKPVHSRNGQKDQSDEDVEGFVIITLTSPVAYLDGIQQSASQKHQCSEACREYEQELSTAWQKIHRLHGQLVNIEAKRMEAIEDQLTEKQLKELRKGRQKPAESHETASASTSDRN